MLLNTGETDGLPWASCPPDIAARQLPGCCPCSMLPCMDAQLLGSLWFARDRATAFMHSIVLSDARCSSVLLDTWLLLLLSLTVIISLISLSPMWAGMIHVSASLLEAVLMAAFKNIQNIASACSRQQSHNRLAPVADPITNSHTPGGSNTQSETVSVLCMRMEYVGGLGSVRSRGGIWRRTSWQRRHWQREVWAL